jgi:hypothetical protein
MRMRQACRTFVSMAWLGLLPAGAAVAAPEIEHQPLRCVVAQTYPWLEVRAPGATRVRVRFRLSGSKDWYAVRLAEDEDAWSGALPKPAATLRAFAYYVEATGPDTQTIRTAEHAVRVVAEESACGAEGVGQSVSDADVVAEAPNGRSALPKGFEGAREEPAGAKVGVFSFSARTSLLAAAGLGAVLGGVAYAVSDNEGPTQSTIEFVSSNPPPNATISLANLALSVRVRLKSSREIAAGTVVLGLRPPDYPGWCITLFGTHPHLAADESVVVTADQPFPYLPCTSPFTTQQANMVVRDAGDVDAFSGDLPISYTFVP